jgi:hypothetical protein
MHLPTAFTTHPMTERLVKKICTALSMAKCCPFVNNKLYFDHSALKCLVSRLGCVQCECFPAS